MLSSALAAGGVWIFVEIADEVFEGETRKLDEAILLSLRNPADLADPIGPSWFEEMMRDFTALGGTAILVALCLAVLGYLLLQKKRRMALFMSAAVIGGVILSSTLKSFFDRPRPDIVPHSAYVMSDSFPSGHSMLSAVVFLTLGGLLARHIKTRRLKIYVLTLSVLATFIVGCSRVYLGGALAHRCPGRLDGGGLLGALVLDRGAPAPEARPCGDSSLCTILAPRLCSRWSSFSAGREGVWNVSWGSCRNAVLPLN